MSPINLLCYSFGSAYIIDGTRGTVRHPKQRLGPRQLDTSRPPKDQEGTIGASDRQGRWRVAAGPQDRLRPMVALPLLSRLIRLHPGRSRSRCTPSTIQRELRMKNYLKVIADLFYELYD
jgi:hypothetical protein